MKKKLSHKNVEKKLKNVKHVKWNVLPRNTTHMMK